MSRKDSVSNGTPFFVKSPAGTIGDLLTGCASMLESEGVPDAEREAREILAVVLDVPRFWAAANSVASASPDVVRSVIRAAILRAKGAPLAYAAGRAAFRHLTLEVDERVLIPRVETEVLIDRILERSGEDTRVIADIGTGSGAIALSLAFERQFDRVYATDISLDALTVAASNAALLARALKSVVEFRHGSLLAPLSGVRLDAIVCNPPYISFAELIDLPPEVRNWEPCIALLSASDGLAATRELVQSAPQSLRRGGLLALEVDTRRAGSVAEMISVDGRYNGVEVLLDLTGRERFVLARRV
ncbi:MAG TPA: peptide chain release factor N(5)-glutamine methyltransferase [Gemmatimonadaceae bacterium]|nr:peptide chain release factor N(5)-glutamine methyltransferase [Gemmatimonadaceae bacterium]